jgi:hypothetical protein
MLRAAAAAQVLDSDQSMEVAGLAALALGLVFTSSCKEDVVEALLTALMSRWGCDRSVACLMLCAFRYLVQGLRCGMLD